jgi:hypothetical protein
MGRHRATARPWLPSVAVTNVAPGRCAKTWVHAHEAPSTLNAGNPRRADSSLTATRPTASSVARSGRSTYGVGW